MKVHLYWYKYDLKSLIVGIAAQNIFQTLDFLDDPLSFNSEKVNPSQVVTFVVHLSWEYKLLEVYKSILTS